jgi:hypothetical protein
MLRAIDVRTHNQYATEAGLHGVKVPFRYNREKLIEQSQVEDVEFDPKQAERAILEAQKRVKSRYV